MGSFEDHCSRQCNKIGRSNSKVIVKIILMDIVLYLENPGFN